MYDLIINNLLHVLIHDAPLQCITVVMTLFVRATRLDNGIPRSLDPQGSKTPKPIDIKLDRGAYVGDVIPHANFRISSIVVILQSVLIEERVDGDG